MRIPPPLRDELRFSNTTVILPKIYMWFIGVEVEQETSAPPPQKNPGSAPALGLIFSTIYSKYSFNNHPPSEITKRDVGMF